MMEMRNGQWYDAAPKSTNMADLAKQRAGQNTTMPVQPTGQLAQAAAQKFGPGLGATPATGPVVTPDPMKDNPFARAAKFDRMAALNGNIRMMRPITPDRYTTLRGGRGEGTRQVENPQYRQYQDYLNQQRPQPMKPSLIGTPAPVNAPQATNIPENPNGVVQGTPMTANQRIAQRMQALNAPQPPLPGVGPKII
jgi:hypothetical protein